MIPLKDINPTRRVPVVTFGLIAACVGSFVLWQDVPSGTVDDLVFNLENAVIPCELVEGRPLTEGEVVAAYGSLGGDPDVCGIGGNPTPAVPDKSPYLAALSSMFFHGDFLHLGGNMLYLWIFGNNIEDHVGRIRYLLLYLVGGVFATFGHVVLNLDSVVPLVGASGAVAVVMGAYLIWFPNAPVRTLVFFGLPLLLTIKAKWLLAVWFGLQFLTNPNSGVAWAAHVAGFVFGVVAALVVRRSKWALDHAWRPDYRGQMDPQHWDPTGGVGPVHEHRRLGSR